MRTIFRNARVLVPLVALALAVLLSCQSAPVSPSTEQTAAGETYPPAATAPGEELTATTPEKPAPVPTNTTAISPPETTEETPAPVPTSTTVTGLPETTEETPAPVPTSTTATSLPETTGETPAPAPTGTPGTEPPETTEEILVYSENITHGLQITPIEDMGITGVAQDVDITTYRLTVRGRVEKPLSLTYYDILAFPSVSELAVLECPGYFTNTNVWTGVPLPTILEEAGMKPGATQLDFYALDSYHKTMTLEHLNEYGAFLAYKVNGVTLPREHGYPLRLVDKAAIGAAWVKWLVRIEVH